MTFEKQTDEMEARLTAFAFGELEGEEHAAMAAAVAAAPALAARVAELRAFGEALGDALSHEAAAPAPAPSTEPASTAATVPHGGRVLRFPAWAWIAAGFATAASVALMVALRAPHPSPEATRSVGNVEPAPAPAPAPVEVAETPVVPPAPTRATEPPAPTFPAMAPAPEAVVVQTPAPPPMKPAVAAPVPAPETVATELALTTPPTTPPTVDAGPGAAQSPVPDDEDIRITPTSSKGAAHRFDATKPPASAGREAGYGPARSSPDGSGGTVAAAGRTKQLEQVSGPIIRKELVRRPDFRQSRQFRRPTGIGLAPAIVESDFVLAASEPVSTFSIDVDTGSYSELRSAVLSRARLTTETIRIEELINYFPYRYAPPPAPGESAVAAPFAAHLSVASAPWAPEHRLVRIAIKGAEIAPEQRPPANLVFVVDVSGSMARSIDLVRFSLNELLDRLHPDDRVAIVAFEGEATLALPSTAAAQRERIRAAIEQLRPNGATNGGDGIALAYDVANEHFRPDGVNRVILCSDGLFNVGRTDRQDLLALIRRKAGSRVYLTALGFGLGRLARGNHLEMLANNGNGAYGYVDSPREGQKVLVDQLEGALTTIANDVKIQVAFNPAQVRSYRLIGYENRTLANEDFRNDSVDAGEIGPGHTITAFYEIVPAAGDARRNRSSAPTPPGGENGDELLALKIRYTAPASDEARTLDFALRDEGAVFEQADEDFRFAAAVAAWGMLLRESPHVGATTFSEVISWAQNSLGDDAGGYRAEFIELVRRSTERRN